MATTDDLTEELYCPICADLFDDPLMLPCTHSFCRKCLQERLQKGVITRKSNSVIFDCPVCRKEIALESEGLDGLPRNRLLKKMVEMHTDRVQKSAADDPSVCSGHGKELGAFCSVCREVVCIDCIVGEHRGHPVESVDDVYCKQRKALSRRQTEIEEQLKSLKETEAEEKKYTEELQEHCRQKSEAIEVQFDEYIGLLQQSKESVLAELEARKREVLTTVQRTLDNVHQRQTELQGTLDTMAQTISLDRLKLLQKVKLGEPMTSTRMNSPLSASRASLNSSLSSSYGDLAEKFGASDLAEALRGSDTFRSDHLRSPRTRCFLDCTLQLDGAALETAINNAHLVWEPEADLFSPKHLADRLYISMSRADLFSPKHLADRFTQLYEKEWKSAYLEHGEKNKDEIASTLLHTLTEAFHEARTCCENHLDSLTYHLLQPDIDAHVGQYNIHGFNKTEPHSVDSATFCSVKEGLRKLRSTHAHAVLQDTMFITHHEMAQLSASLGSGINRQASVYTNKFFEVCFTLQLQDPPLHIALKREPVSDSPREPATESSREQALDRNIYKHVKRRGRKFKCAVWPPLYLYKDGPLLAKGVVFVPG